MSNFKVNKVIVLLTLTDIFSWGVYFALVSLLGLYLSTKFNQNAIEFVGIGYAVYSVTRGLFQIPVGIFSDKIKKDIDEITFLLIGVILMGSTFLAYPLISQPMHYYFLQFIFGLGAAFNMVNWRKLFARNLDKNKEGLEYSLYDSTMSLSVGLFSVIAGIVANINDTFFNLVVVGLGVLIISSSFWVLLIFTVKDRNSNKSDSPIQSFLKSFLFGKK